ncbi:AI-2E family transporter [Pseudolysinimonas sp.]|uniref:AI-2E family transporter n=1 Tax=Pseudolysinimonas sp. TaxID=2680009 RepID=UPI003F7FE75B
MKIQNAFRLGLFGGLGVLVAIVIGGAVTSLATILTYVGAALFLALGIDPAVSFLQRHKFPRPAAIAVVLVVVLGVAAGLIFALIPVLSDQITNLIKQIPTITQAFNNGQIESWWNHTFPWLKYNDVLTNVQDFFTKNVQSITGGVLTTAVTIGSGAFGVLIVVILTLYFVASLSSIKRGLYQLVPATRREKFIDISEQISKAVGRYVIGQVSLGLCNGILSFIFLLIMSFATGVKYYALLAFIAFLFSLVPLVGTLVGSIIITLSAWLFSDFNLWTLIIVGAYYIVYMQVEAYVLSPNIMNRAVKVPGVVVVIAALAGGTLLGILGALIAIPVAAAILLIVKQVIVPRQNAL